MISKNADGSLTLRCILQPNAAKDEVVGEYNGLLKIRISSPPVDGKANTQLIKFLSKAFGVPKSHVSLLKGHTSRQKTVSIVAPQQLPPIVSELIKS
ncbi:DUF167 family protein [Aurantivibrio plasticivorans]